MQRTTRAHRGWTQEERELMWREIREADEVGETLKKAFDIISEKTGRKPNSIRNRYYQSLRDPNTSEKARHTRAKPFEPFSKEETDTLLRTILTEKAKGVSVRACVLGMGGGDRRSALRYQNKYRSILKNHPEKIAQMAGKLCTEGIDCEAIRTLTNTCGQRPQNAPTQSRERGAKDIGAELRHREEIDRMEVRCDLLRLELARREERAIAAHGAYLAFRRDAFALAEACLELLSTQDTDAAKGVVEQRIAALATTLTE